MKRQKNIKKNFYYTRRKFAHNRIKKYIEEFKIKNVDIGKYLDIYFSATTDGNSYHYLMLVFRQSGFVENIKKSCKIVFIEFKLIESKDDQLLKKANKNIISAGNEVHVIDGDFSYKQCMSFFDNVFIKNVNEMKEIRLREIKSLEEKI